MAAQNNEDTLILQCLWVDFADDRARKADLWNCLHTWNGFKERYGPDICQHWCMSTARVRTFTT
jgi:hypothetical protein